MSDARVVFQRGARAKQEVLDVRINGNDPTYRLRSDRISSAIWMEIDDVCLDLLDIAAAVNCSDSSVSRGGDKREDFGAKWHRHFDFDIRVRKPEIWSRPELRDALKDCVSFLSDDTVAFRFDQGHHRPQIQSYLQFDNNHDKRFAADDVILFSGGLDSFAGALQTLCETERRVALVTHRSAPKTITFQTNLAKYLETRFPGRVLHIAVGGHRVKSPARETTLRSRSFLFAALGYTVARCLGAKRICFFENGVVSHNLPISPQVIGSMATRTTHPLALEKFRTVLNNLEPIPIHAPFEWLTKVDILKIIERHGALDQIKRSNSCAHVREQNILHTHCGNCSQCIDRRFAILAAGLTSHEPEEMYGTDVIFGERNKPRSRTLAFEWTRHALTLIDMTKSDFLNKFTGELSRILEGYPDTPNLEVFNAVYEMHARHGAHVKKALSNSISTYPDRILALRGSPTSLMTLIIGAGLTIVPKMKRLTPSTPEAGLQSEHVFDRHRMEVCFDIRKGEPRLTIRSLGTVYGAPARVGHDLLPYYEEDFEKKLPATDYQFVPVGTLAKISETSKSAVAQNVKRCRDQFQEFYLGVYNSTPPEPILIQSKKSEGYRLDPECRVVASDLDSE